MFTYSTYKTEEKYTNKYTYYMMSIKIFAIQLVMICMLFLVFWGMQRIYGAIDSVVFPKAYFVPKDVSDENERGKLLLDSITHQMRRELDSPFGWTVNDILFNRYLLDNRASRQYGVYHGTKILMDNYSMVIAKLGANDRESPILYRARLNEFAIDPRSFIFPSAEGRYRKGLEAVEAYKKGLDSGQETYNCRTDDIYASLNVVVGQDLLGYALGLLSDAQDMPCWELDNRIYEAQGIVLVVRDFLEALYALYPAIAYKNNEDNMREAIKYLDKICTYDPLYITSSFNSGELVISWLMFAKNRLEDVRDSIRI